MKRQILADGRLYDGLKGVVGLNSALLRLKNRPAVRTMLILSAPRRMGPKGATMSPILYSSIYRSPQWYKNYSTGKWYKEYGVQKGEKFRRSHPYWLVFIVIKN